MVGFSFSKVGLYQEKCFWRAEGSGHCGYSSRMILKSIVYRFLSPERLPPQGMLIQEYCWPTSWLLSSSFRFNLNFSLWSDILENEMMKYKIGVILKTSRSLCFKDWSFPFLKKVLQFDCKKRIIYLWGHFIIKCDSLIYRWHQYTSHKKFNSFKKAVNILLCFVKLLKARSSRDI